MIQQRYKRKTNSLIMHKLVVLQIIIQALMDFRSAGIQTAWGLVHNSMLAQAKIITTMKPESANGFHWHMFALPGNQVASITTLTKQFASVILVLTMHLCSSITALVLVIKTTTLLCTGAVARKLTIRYMTAQITLLVCSCIIKYYA